TEAELGLARVAKKSPLHVSLLLSKSYVLHRRGRGDEAAQTAELGLGLAQTHGWTEQLPSLYNVLGVVFTTLRRHAAARDMLEHALIEAEAQGKDRWSTLVWGNLASELALQGDAEGARHCLAKAQALVERFADPS